MNMKDEENCAKNESRVVSKKKITNKIVVSNTSSADAKMTLEEMVKKYLLKKAVELKDEVA